MKNNRPIKIVSLFPVAKRKEWKNTHRLVDRYIDFDEIIDTPRNMTMYLTQPIDILFIDSDSFDAFNVKYYKLLKNNKANFKLIVVKEKHNSDDIRFFKGLADDILHTSNKKLAEWKKLAILRRFWKTSAKSTTVIYKDVIADFIENNISVNNVDVSLTSKERDLFKYLLEKRGSFTSKKKIYKEIWGYDEDVTRTLDQMFFKLKKKISPEYFYSSRTKGYKFE
ncbi:MAG: winged helix-turn-helix domain-containing protein [Mycoplasmataceae bacterium]|nr:winged helix-turn-helix domain-containing protein [Mycoplasmataceae bacterium]